MFARGTGDRSGGGGGQRAPRSTLHEPSDRRHRRRLASLAILCGLLVAACSGGGPQGSTDTAAGKELWGTNCAMCHGVNGEGVSAPSLNSQEFLTGVTDEQMDDIIRHGVQGSAMPAWWDGSGGSLTEQQISDIVAYVRSWQSAAPSCPDWQVPDCASASG